ncbi:hypothetical protein AB1Y20_003586 [Prymnesium parvum]|uniref:Calmodulin n=1 Tax=Prymnesium parvum TaxID=97485 RepID=A0AB34J840_PRYPA
MMRAVQDSDKAKSSAPPPILSSPPDKWLQRFAPTTGGASSLSKEAELAAQQVETLIKQDDASDQVPELKRFGCHLVVVLEKHGKQTTRMIVVIEDKVGVRELFTYCERCLGAAKGESKSWVFRFFDDHGRSHQIDSSKTLHRWIDQRFATHPPVLHIYDTHDLVVDQQEHMRNVMAIFNEYDKDGSGHLSFAELKDMVMTMGLAKSYNVAEEQVEAFAVAQFRKADMNGDKLITFDEFVDYYNGLRDVLKDSLIHHNKHTFTQLRFKEQYVEARSYRRRLWQVMDEDGGVLHLNMNGHDYGIQIRFPEGCITEANSNMWVRAQTLLEHKVDHYEDDSGTLGEIFSPVVLLESEDDFIDSFFVQHELDIEIEFPHCFNRKLMEEGSKDAQVAFSFKDTERWELVSTEFWSFVHAIQSFGSQGSIKIKTRAGGTFAAFANSKSKVHQHVVCMAFLPEKLIPLEHETLRIHIVPKLPNAIEGAYHTEYFERGNVHLAGKSNDLTVVVGPGDVCGLQLSLEQANIEVHGGLWKGEPMVLEFEFDPQYFLESVEEAQLADKKGDENGSQRKAPSGLNSLDITSLRSGNFTVNIQVINRDSVQRGKRTSIGGDSFSVAATIHDFPPPSAPTNLQITSRNNLSLHLRWEAPSKWGGCCLSVYEIQIADETAKGKVKDWETHSKVDASSSHAAIALNVYKCKIRIRAFNVGCLEASPWSEVISLGPEEDLKPQPRPSNAASAGSSGIVAEAGSAVVMQDDISQFAKRKSIIGSVPHVVNDNMKGWSPFKKAVGSLFLEFGVRDGVKGKMFDLTPQQAEDLVVGANMDTTGVDTMKPLISFACAAVWVLETLAHHTAQPSTWIRMMNDVEGLVNMAAHQKVPWDEPTIPLVKNILWTLFNIYETIRQSEPDGFITRQLAFKYKKDVRRQLKEDFENRLLDLKNEIASTVMNMVLQNRKLGVQDVGVLTQTPSGNLACLGGALNATRYQIQFSRFLALNLPSLSSRLHVVTVSIEMGDGESPVTGTTLPVERMGGRCTWSSDLIKLTIPKSAMKRPLQVSVEVGVIGFADDPTPVAVAEIRLAEDRGVAHCHEMQFVYDDESANRSRMSHAIPVSPGFGKSMDPASREKISFGLAYRILGIAAAEEQTD